MDPSILLREQGTAACELEPALHSEAASGCLSSDSHRYAEQKWVSGSPYMCHCIQRALKLQRPSSLVSEVPSQTNEP